MKQITIIKKTWLKKSDTKQSFELDPSEKVEVKAGTQYPIVALREAKNNHVYFTLDGLVLGAKKYNSWYVYKPHTSLEDSPKSRAEVPQTGELPQMSGSIEERVVAVCDAKGYPLDLSGDVNIIGIEAMNLDGSLNNDEPDKWNDLIGVLRFNSNRKPYFEHLYVGTTEPGRFYTTSASRNRKGAARVDLGFHKDIWVRGKHKDRYDALCQWGGDIRIRRDYNMDFSRVGDLEYEGSFGINLHSTSPNHTPGSIGKYSAGCQVIQNWSDFQKLLKTVYASPKKKFSYILLMGEWLV